MNNFKLALIVAGFLAVACILPTFADDKPANHNKMWEYYHGLQAKQNVSNCMVCHTNEKTCLDCHKQTFNAKNKPRSHSGNNIIIHQLDAKRNAASCNTCHEPNYCAKCHQSLNKAKSATVTSPTQPQSHSASNWRTALHGTHAKKNMSQCQVCHPDLYTVSPCTSCHSGKTNISGTPHPSGYKASQFKDLTVCYKCHGTGTSDGPSAGPLTL